ncbi:MAG: FHA domain-containing protein [Planctomycetota bacterium]
MTTEPINPDIPEVTQSAPQVRLVVQKGAKGEQVIECRRIVTLLGSRSGCKLVLPNRRVEPVHLAILQTGTKVIGIDLATQKGTLLNDLKLLYEPLSNGDRLGVGPWEFRVGIDRGDEASDDVNPFGLEPTPQVIALEHVPSGRILQPTREACLIGRRRPCDVTVEDLNASRVHAILFTYHGYPAIVDLISRNHTYVNNEPVCFSMLHNEDTLAIGESRFIVRVLSAGVGRVTQNATSPRNHIEPVSADTSDDLVDIATTDLSQRWSVVDQLQKAEKRR